MKDNSGITNRCISNKNGKCIVVANCPESLNCPCNFFLACDKIALKNFKKVWETYCGKKRVWKRIQYHDLLRLNALRAKGKERKKIIKDNILNEERIASDDIDADIDLVDEEDKDEV